MSSWQDLSLIDRCEAARADPALVAGWWTSPRARVLPVTGDGRLALTPQGGLVLRPAPVERDSRHLFAGLVEAGPVFIETGADLPGAPTLREVMDGLSATDLELAFLAVGLAGWHRRAAHCGACGTPMIVTREGMARLCPGCGVEHYPRTDPAVIVAVTDPEDRLLLGRQPVWAKGRVSVFAGFVETGESLEQAVHREVFEEVGLRLDRPCYLGSQPWPFPRSMMVGFTARAASIDLQLADGEIEEARWFTRDQLDAALAAGELTLPMRTSIAHRMITDWRNRRLIP